MGEVRRAAGGRPAAAGVQDDDATYDPGADEELPESESLLPVAVGAPAPAPDDELELEIDEGFLQRIRDI